MPRARTYAFLASSSLGIVLVWGRKGSSGGNGNVASLASSREEFPFVTGGVASFFQGISRHTLHLQNSTLRAHLRKNISSSPNDPDRIYSLALGNTQECWVTSLPMLPIERGTGFFLALDSPLAFELLEKKEDDLELSKWMRNNAYTVLRGVNE